jgi:hypothetical protein
MESLLMMCLNSLTRPAHTLSSFQQKKQEIPLSLNGVIPYFKTTTPTAKELEELPQIVLTSPQEWRPHSPSYAKAEKGVAVAAVAAVWTKNALGDIFNVPRVISAVQSQSRY